MGRWYIQNLFLLCIVSFIMVAEWYICIYMLMNHYLCGKLIPWNNFLMLLSPCIHLSQMCHQCPRYVAGYLFDNKTQCNITVPIWMFLPIYEFCWQFDIICWDHPVYAPSQWEMHNSMGAYTEWSRYMFVFVIFIYSHHFIFPGEFTANIGESVCSCISSYLGPLLLTWLNFNPSMDK